MNEATTTEQAHYSIVHTTEYRYVGDVSDQHNSIRVRPRNGDGQVLEGFDVTVDPGARLYAHTDYFGTEVIQFAISGKHDHLAIRAEARVRVNEPEPPPGPGLGAAGDARVRGARRRVPGPARPARQPGADHRARRRGARRLAAADAEDDLQPDPRPLRVPGRRHLRRLDRQRPARRRRRRLPGLRPSGADDDAARGHRLPLRLRLPLRPQRRRLRLLRGQHPRLARGAAARGRRQPALGRRRSDEPQPDRRLAREDRSRPRLLGRAADPRRLPGARRTPPSTRA